MTVNHSDVDSLGLLSSKIVSRNAASLTEVDPNDVFSFNILNNRNINLLLHNISSGDDADLRLFRDSNNNGVFDSTDRQVASSRRGGNANDIINYNATAGTYFAQVERYARASNGSVTYDLDLSAIYNIGNLTSKTVRRNNASLTVSDPNDVFRVNVLGNRNINLLLHNISRGDDADLRLFRDSNNNGVFDSDDSQVASSRRSSNANDSIKYNATAGTYFAQVERYGRASNGSVNYDLDLSAQAKQTRLRFDNIGFSITNQSLWGANNINVEHSKFLGPKWNKSSKKKVVGFTVEGQTSGRIGLQSDFKFDGGRLNASLPIDMWLDIPENVVSGETITIRSGFSLDNSASFSTTGLQASYDLDFIFDADVKASIKGYGLKYRPNLDPKDFSRNLLSLNANSARFSLSERQLGGFGSFDINLPQINTQSRRSGTNSLSSVGSDNFLNASLDLDKVATTLARSLSLPVPDLGGRKDFWFGHVNYDLLDIDLNAALTARQKFDLQVDELTGQLVLENGKRIDFIVGEDVTFTVPDNIGNSLGISAVLDLDADFRNQSALDYNVGATLKALSLDGRIGWDAPWPLPDIYKDFSLGPVYSKPYKFLKNDLELYDQTFDLVGIGQQTINFDVPALS